MTQEELDLLMTEDLDELDNEKNDEALEDLIQETKEEKQDNNKDQKEELLHNYKVDPNETWPPPPPTKEHKVVGQLDDVTKDSEIKATEIFEKLELISDFMANIEQKAQNLSDILDKNIEIFAILSEKFPEIEHFSSCLKNNENAKESIKSIEENAQAGSDEVMMIMDIMQYQDIHRQKIERVINVMRALSKYMNTLFEGKIEDTKRVGSATHIEGDSSTEDVVSNEEIEALIANLGK